MSLYAVFELQVLLAAGTVLEHRRDHHQSCKITTNVISIARSLFLTEEATTQWWNTRLLVDSIARSFLPQKEETTITRSNNTRVEHEQKRKIEIGYVNINNTGNIQNSRSKEGKHSIQPVAQTNYQAVRTQENRVSKY